MVHVFKQSACQDAIKRRPNNMPCKVLKDKKVNIRVSEFKLITRSF